MAAETSSNHRRRRPDIHASLVLILGIVFLAVFIRSAFGFGEALVAVPLLALCMPLWVATPLAVLLSVTVAAIVLVQDWRHTHLRSAVALIVSSLFGIPLGLLILSSRHQEIVKVLLGLLIFVFALCSLRSTNSFRLKREHPLLVILAGFLSGILGGAYGMNGPPLVMYGSMRGWNPQQFRSTLQAYFLPASMLGMAGYWSAGLWTSTVTRDYFLSIPAMLPAIFLGRFVNHRLSSGSYLKYVYAGLALIGGVLVVQALAQPGIGAQYP